MTTGTPFSFRLYDSKCPIMLPAALLPWWPYADPPSDSVLSVTDPASDVKMAIFAPDASDEEVVL